MAAARRRFASERGAAAAGSNGGGRLAATMDGSLDHPAPPVAPPQIKRARSVPCRSSHGASPGGLLPVVLSKATAEAAAASRQHRDEALMFASMRMMKTSSSPATAPAPPPPASPLPLRRSRSSLRRGRLSLSAEDRVLLRMLQVVALSLPADALLLVADAHAAPRSKLGTSTPFPPSLSPLGRRIIASFHPQGARVQPDEVCWARLLSYPWWPAVVKHPPPPSAFALRHKPESIYVVFFGDGNCAWLSPRSARQVRRGYAKRSAKPRKDLQKAVDEAWMALGVERPGVVVAGGKGESGGEELALPGGVDEKQACARAAALLMRVRALFFSVFVFISVPLPLTTPPTREKRNCILLLSFLCAPQPFLNFLSFARPFFSRVH